MCGGVRVSTEIGLCNERLLKDDEDMEMDEEERQTIMKDITALEQELGYWCKIFSGRMEEKKVPHAILATHRA